MLVGVTGGIGAGKSSLARLLQEKGAALVDADRIGHEVIERPPVCRALRAAFGDEVVGADGRIDRGELGRRAFASDDGRRRLNRIVHPPLLAELWRQVESAAGPGGEGVVVVDAALIIECGLADRCDAIVLVQAAEDRRIERVTRARRLSPAEIRQRMVSQMPDPDKATRADFVVENNGDLRDLAAAADRIWPQLLCRARAGKRQRDA